VEPGLYRLVVSRNGGNEFCEFNLALDPGPANRVTVRALESPDYRCTDDRTLYGVLRSVDEVADHMVRVGAGEYKLGKAGTGVVEEILLDPVVLDEFYIDKTEVSNYEYREFVNATGYPPPAFWSCVKDFDEIGERPVIWLSVGDAETYARWRGKRLPTLFEWQAAARGTACHMFPCGDSRPVAVAPPPYGPTVEAITASHLAHTVGTRTAAPWDDASGLLNTFSNVREVTGTADPRERCVFVAGRGWSDPVEYETLKDVRTMPLNRRGTVAGFRCAKSARVNEKDRP
jgi:formylglycine-generating enzyme required for sulfatase activity